MTWQPFPVPPSLLGESPFWHPHERLLYWIDIPGKQILRCDGAGASVETWDMPLEPGCIAPALRAGKADGLVVALRDGIYRARSWRGKLERIVQIDHDTATTRFNDGKADPVGRFWAGTMYEPRDKDLAQLVSVDCRDGKSPLLEVKVSNAILANGLAWSPDTRTVYWTDTQRHNIRAWDWDSSSNVMHNARLFREWPGKPAGWRSGMPGYGGRPDGAAVDIEGNYHVAMFEGARILKLAPSGQVLSDTPVPAFCPTMPCFGGDDLKTMYVTSACYNRSAEELAKYPHSGRVFSMRVEQAGLPVNFFRD